MITRAADWGLDTDSRWKKWAKLIRSIDDIDLSKANGYSLTGPWVGWTDSVALGEGQYLVIAAESGSRANHPYSYEMIIGGGDELRADDHIARNADIDAALAAGKINEQMRAAAQNSCLYSFALWAWLQYQATPAVDRDALAAERERLVARIAEIDAQRGA